jgi:hypothetical protein
MGYGVLALRSIVWLSKTGLDRNAKSALGFILAVSVGVAIFLAAYLSRDFLTTNFGFRHIRELFHRSVLAIASSESPAAALLPQSRRSPLAATGRDPTMDVGPAASGGMRPIADGQRPEMVTGEQPFIP